MCQDLTFVSSFRPRLHYAAALLVDIVKVICKLWTYPTIQDLKETGDCKLEIMEENLISLVSGFLLSQTRYKEHSENMIEGSVPYSHLTKRDGDRSPCPVDSPPEIGSSQSFNVSCGLDYNGGFADMYQAASPSLTDCVDKCASHHPQCVAVSYEASEAHGTNNCYLKNATPPLVLRSYVMDSAVAIWPTGNEEDCAGISGDFTTQGVSFETHCGQDYPYNDYKQAFATSLEDCMGQCASVKGSCAGVSYEASMAHGYMNCYLKSAVGVNLLMTQDFVVDSAFVVKRQSGSSSAISLTAQASSSFASTATSDSISSLTPGLLLSMSSATTAPSSASATTPGAEASTTATGAAVAHTSTSKAWIAGAVIGPIVGIIIIALLCMLFFRRRKATRRLSAPPAYSVASEQVHDMSKYPEVAGNYGGVPQQRLTSAFTSSQFHEQQLPHAPPNVPQGASQIEGRPVYEAS
ncbi:hypothetical protein K491DRAFT_737430 [Lophiostoma macrostomum CBS 122681]|uniref:Apple domain-containing protein n=1 Tax=Lophiostoma macrostomum CBS 122681 TaxID=1314788 RepID=A0A6A6SLX1_9PLEO|nr:hypothetical protein K491DRAFT_737430 [Lophiostoma macrostomum CBS 122681]